jgi:hypothetical protein
MEWAAKDFIRGNNIIIWFQIRYSLTYTQNIKGNVGRILIVIIVIYYYF